MSGSERTMRAAVYRGDRTVVVEDVAVPPVGPGEVLLRVSHCGVCGSDLHLMMEDWGTPGAIGGHEYSGVVAAVGAGVAGWAEGDAAVGGPAGGCGTCPQCLAGSSHLCAGRAKDGVMARPGAFAGYKVIEANRLFRVPDGVGLRTAALTEPLAVALRGVRKAKPAAGTRALVTGAGPIGLLTVAVLRADGVEDVTVSEPGEKRRALARRIGASTVISPDGLTVPAMPMDLVAEPYQVAFECSGRPDAMEKALANLDRSGMLVLSGTGMRRPRFDTNRIILNELVMTGTVEYTPGDYHAALGLLATGRVPARELIEPEDVPLAGLQGAMERLMTGDLAGKVLVNPRG